jgi:phage shock protein A
MGILSRIGNIMKAKANRVVEAEESKDPVGIMKSQLHEAQENLGQFESAVSDQGANMKSLEKKVVILRDEVKKWEKNAEAALTEGNEDLAGKALERQTEKEEELLATKTGLKNATATFEKMRTKVVAEKKKIDACKGKMSSLEARQKAAQANLKMRETFNKFEGNGNPMDQISVFEDKIDAMENKAEICEDMADEASGANLDAEFAELESKGAVSDKMAALKAKMAKKETA